MSNPVEKIKHYCPECQSNTNHIILSSHELDTSEEGYNSDKTFQIVQCCGCEHIEFRTVFRDFESIIQYDIEEWGPELTIHNYPKSLKKRYIPLEYSWSLPTKINIVYHEAIKAFEAGCFLLTGVAFRAVIEAVCLENSISGRNLEVKINNLVNKKLITEKEAERLHAVRFIGNDAVHEMSVPHEDQLYSVLQIIQHLLKNLYIIDRHFIGNLETIVTELPNFINLINSKLQKVTSSIEEVSLRNILGRDYRRVPNLSLFEIQMIEDIRNGNYDLLSLTSIKLCTASRQNQQHYTVNTVKVEEVFKPQF